MDLTKLQLSELMCKHAAKGNGLHDLMEIMLDSIAGSTGKCKISDLFEKLGLWVRKTEFFARSEVQFLCDVLNILVRDVIEV